MKNSSIIGLAALGGIGGLLLLNKKSTGQHYYYAGYDNSGNPIDYNGQSGSYAGVSDYPSGNVSVPIRRSTYIKPANTANSNALQYSVNQQTGRTQVSYASPITMRASAYSSSYIPFRQSSGSRIADTGIEDFIPQHYLPQRPAHNPIDYVYVTPVNPNFDPALAPVEVTPINPYFAPIDYVTVTPQNPNVPATDDLAYVQVTPQYQPISYVQVTPQYQPIDYVQVTPTYQPISYVDVTPQVYSPPPQYTPATNYYSVPQYYVSQPYYSSPQYNSWGWGSYYGGEAYFSGSNAWFW